MIIELMIMLIVVGAGIVLVAWSNTRRRKQDALDRREVEDSTSKLKQELERTATEIIGRMEKHVTHLESILDESEKNRTQLEGRVAELKKLIKKSESQAVEVRDLMARLEDAGAEVESMRRKMETIDRRLNLVISTPLAMQQPIQQPIQQPMQPIQQPIQQPVAIPQMSPPLINPLITSPITAPPITSMQPAQVKPPISKPIQPITPTPNVQVTTAPPAPPMNPLGPITIQPTIKAVESDKDFDKILEETIAEPPKVEEPARVQIREPKVFSQETKQPVKMVEADPVKIEATRQKLTKASLEMANKPPEEVSEVEPPPQVKDSKKKRTRRSKRDVRLAAIEAIKEVEKQNELESKAAPEPKKSSPPEKPKPLEKIEPRRELKLETTDSSIIKEMLLAGMSIEEISRETGLGRGAIELIQEMTRRQLNRK